MKKFFKLLSAGSLLLAISALLSRILGVYRDHVFAKVFGAGAELDAYYAAFIVPDILYALLIMSSVSAVFLPMFQKYKVKKNWDKAWQFTSSVLNTLLLVFAAISALLILFAEPLVALYVPKFSAEQQELTITMMRWMLLSPFFFTFSSVMIAVENAFQKFFAQALAPVLYNIGIIFGVQYLSPFFGIEAVAYGVVFGAFLQMLIQVPFFLQTGFSWSPRFLKGKELKEMSYHFFPRVLSSSLIQVSVAANVIIGGFLAAGSITLYNLAFNVQSLSFGMIAVSISIPAFALLSEQAAKKNMKAFQKTLQNNFEKIYFWMIPANTGIYIIADPLVKFLFEYGKFSESDAVHLVHLIQLFSLGLMLTGGIILLTKAFLAIQKTWFVTTVGVLAVILDIIVSIYLAQKMGVEGLVWGTIIALLFRQIVLVIVSWKTFGRVFSLFSILGMLIISALMFVTLQKLALYLQNYTPLLQLIFLGSVGGIIYLGLMKFMTRGRELY